MSRRIHVIPVGDHEIHDAQETCRCKPLVGDDLVVTHNAKDCREARERTTKGPCSEGWVLIGEEI